MDTDAFNGTEVGLLEGLTDGTIYGKFEGLLLGNWLGSVDRHWLDNNEGTELGFYSGNGPSKALMDPTGTTPFTFDDTLI